VAGALLVALRSGVVAPVTGTAQDGSTRPM
jgi:hypothetical protein